MPEQSSGLVVHGYRPGDETAVARPERAVGAELRSRGAHLIHLHVEAQNANSLADYESAGGIRTHGWRRFGKSRFS